MPSGLLFEEPAGPPRPLAAPLRALAARGVYIGTSSWKYPGWLGQIYTAERYLVRGRFSQRKFEAECLAEYAESFPIVGGDFSFYQFPTPEYWARLFRSAPASLLYALKVPEEITVRTWPRHARYGPQAGTANPGFLDAAMLGDLFLAPLEPFRRQVAALMFEFGSFSHTAYAEAEDFAADLGAFLERLPGGWPYSVEIRNPEFLAPPYLDCLRRHGVAHVLNSWTRMPELDTQMRPPGGYTAPFTVVRALLRPGRSYEQAVRLFSPYEAVRDAYPAGRRALAEIVSHGLRERRPTLVFVNNRFEGNAIETIGAIVEGADP